MDANFSPAPGMGKIKRQWLEATVTRADGTVEHLGIIADTRLSWRITQAVKRAHRSIARLFGKDS